MKCLKLTCSCDDDFPDASEAAYGGSNLVALRRPGMRGQRFGLVPLFPNIPTGHSDAAMEEAQRQSEATMIRPMPLRRHTGGATW